jgi:DNA topoisomerase-1
MSKSLVVVESPTKAHTIKKYLGKNYQVIATVGHIKNLPKSKLGVDIEKGFEPEFVLIRGKGDVVKKLREAAKKADQILLAPDPDREGEAIAYHVSTEIKDQKKGQKVQRILFNEITKKEVLRAVQNPIPIDENKVLAQQARRILDRLVGYKVSPLLWSSVRKGLSAGRVQSVALRLVVEREREIQAFQKKEYWTISALFEGEEPTPFEAKLAKFDGENFEIPDQVRAAEIEAELKLSEFKVTKVDKKERLRNPSAPYTTSTLQQDASRKLRFTSKKTMVLAQRLYEGMDLGTEGPMGLITYHRTDSTRIAAEALAEVREAIQKRFGTEFVPEKPNFYKSKKMAQQAHEAVRPTSISRSPESVAKYLGKDELQLYRLIYNRFLASQMRPAVMDVTAVDIESGKYLFRANGSTVRFIGFLKAFESARDADKQDTAVEEKFLPEIAEGETVRAVQIQSEQHFTQPPPRYTEATLIREMEENGIGRPSTYSSIMEVIQSREYVEMVDRQMVPTELGMLITDLLVENFPDIFNVEFTAMMEEELDQVEEGKKGWVDSLNDFYNPFKADLATAETRLKTRKKQVEETDEICEKCGSKMIIKWGRFGKFIACSAYPECKNTKQIQNNGEGQTVPPEKNQRPTGEKCPNCGADMVLKNGRFGEFIACSKYPKCKTTKTVTTGISCPEKGCPGTLVQRRTKSKKTFYSCSEYPKCKFAIWQKPIPEECPKCGHPFLVAATGKKAQPNEFKCGNKSCDFQKVLEETDPSKLSAAV